MVIAAITSCTNTSNPSVMLARRPAREESRRARLKSKPWVKTSLAPGSKVVTDYYRRGRPARRISKQLQFPPGGLRLHHLHRQQRPAAGRGRAGGAEGEPGGGRGAERQPQFRGPHQSAGEGQLPGLAAAGGGLRAGRPHRYRPRQRSAGRRTERQAGLPARHLAFQRGSGKTRAQRPCSARCSSKEYARSLRRRRATGRACRCPTGDIYQWDASSTYIKKPPYFDDMVDPADARYEISAACACWRCWAIPSPPTTSRPPAPFPRTSPAGQYLIAQGVKPGGFQLLRRAARQSRSDGARHACQHPPAQSAGARNRGRLDAAPARRRADVHLRRVDALSEGRRAADDHRRQGIRLGLVARLGGEGRAAAGRARGDRGKLRAHPPHQSGGHGRAAAAIPARRNAGVLGLTGHETFHHRGRAPRSLPRAQDARRARREDGGREKVFPRSCAWIRREEVEYYRNGGILPYVLRQML